MDGTVIKWVVFENSPWIVDLVHIATKILDKYKVKHILFLISANLEHANTDLLDSSYLMERIVKGPFK